VKRLPPLVLALVALLIAVVLVVSPSIEEAAAVGTGVFYSRCTYDHSAEDDPIVFFGQPGAAHNHDFFGGAPIDAFTEPADLVGGATTCPDSGDTAGYWAPSLYIDGQQIVPTRINARYAAGGKDPATIQPFPQGLKIIAGSKILAGGGIEPGSDKYLKWGCKNGPNNPNKRFYMNCGSTEATANVEFPDCWDGVNLDSDDHREHMTYSTGNPSHCPENWVSLPSLSIKVHYGTNIPVGTATLSSGATNTFHADFLQSWVPERLQEVVDDCIVANLSCIEES
jgi:hypothetical protein